MADAQCQHHRQNGTDGEERFERGPQHLGQHDVVQRDRRVEDAVPGFLHVHARKRGIQRLERGGVHRAHANAATGQKDQIGHRLDLSTGQPQIDAAHQRPHAVAEGDQPDERLGDVAHQAGDGEFSPHQQIAQPHGREAACGTRGMPDRAGWRDAGWLREGRGRCHGVDPTPPPESGARSVSETSLPDSPGGAAGANAAVCPAPPAAGARRACTERPFRR
jgi:hypothetical protein